MSRHGTVFNLELRILNISASIF